ncbi:type II secretion system F family protein [Sphingomonas sp. UNC305MFCol5.2]|uniref:type II secretion system F family protein n=1 Tax=Sphingomonas sp. UNC305MFCol5.2 TaxID=1449076 RepID=UPI0004707027|nr:type II secretion system F family protein [Sphingomonas sp. UNC305MFCol5.2]
MSMTSIRLIVLALIFAAVILAVEGMVTWIRANRGGVRAINERLRLIATGHDRPEVLARLRRDAWGGGIYLPGPLANTGRKLDNLLRGASFGMSPARLLFLMVLAVGFLFIATVIFALAAGLTISFGTLLMAACFAGATGLGLPLMFIARRADRRRKRMAEQFPVALDIFVRGLRAGHPVAAALDLLTQEMSDPIGSEFGIVTDEVAYGADLRDALHSMANRCDLDDLRMFVVSLSVQSETGGNLAEILENLSRVIRDRASMVLMVRALSSEGRMTATILTALPVLAFVALFLLNPPFYLQVANDPAFSVGFGCLIVLYAVGFVIIRRLVNLKV